MVFLVVKTTPELSTISHRDHFMYLMQEMKSSHGFNKFGTAPLHWELNFFLKIQSIIREDKQQLVKIGAKIAQGKHRKSLVILKIPFSRNIIMKCNGIDNQLYGGSIDNL